MKKLIVSIMLPLLSAGSAFAGDAANAADAGYRAPLPLAIIIGVLLIVGTAIFLYKHFRGAKKPVVTISTIVATMAALQAGDFANAADAGYGLDRRSGAVVSGINAIGRGSSYISDHPLESLTFVYNMSDNGSTPRVTAGAMLDSMRNGTSSGTSLNAAGPYPSQIAVGPLSGTTGNFRWGTTLCDY